MGGFPVKIVDSGGLPVVASFDGGPAVTQSDNGIPVTVVESGGVPLSFVNDDLSEDLNLGALARVQAAAPDFVAWWTSADPTSMLLASDGVGGFVSASGQTVGGWLNVKDCGSKTFAQYLAAQPELWAHDLVTATGESEIIGDNVYRIYSSAGANSFVGITAALTVGSWYDVTFTIDSISAAGSGIRIQDGGPVYSTVGQHHGIFKASNTVMFIKRNLVACDYQISGVSVKALPDHHLFGSGAGKPQYLLSGGIGSVNADGVDDHLSTGALASALPSDCAVYARVKTTDDRGYIFSGAATDSNEYFFCFQDGLTSPVYGNVGSPTLYVDDTEFTGHRGDYYDAISDGAQHSLVARSIDLSGLAALTLAAYLPSPTVNYVSGAIGDILIVPEALLTAQPTLHADIMAMMAARSPS